MQTFEEKERFWRNKMNLTEERISLLTQLVNGGLESDALKLNAYKLEIVSLEADLEGITATWDHYTERVSQIRVIQGELTKECEENYKNYCDIFNSISPEALKQYSNQLQEQYHRMKPVLEKELGNVEKNAVYSLLKEVLIRMKKIA